MTNGINVISAALNPMDPREVTLTVNPMTPNANYRVTVSNVKGAAARRRRAKPHLAEYLGGFHPLTAPVSQTINFPALADKFIGNPPFTISATGGPSDNRWCLRR